MSQVDLKPLGDDGILVRFEEKILVKTNLKVQSLLNSLSKESIKGIKEFVPSYRSLLIFYNPLEISFDDLKEKILNSLDKKEKIFIKKKKIVEIPAYFGKDLAPDLDFVSKYHNLSDEKIINILLKKIYYVYMYGFLPGFIYLGGLPKILHTPRLDSPRILIPKGSIGIGGEQLGIYSLPSPGGFRIIGFTYLNLFEIDENLRVKISEGDFVKFRRVSKDEFLKNYDGEIKFLWLKF